MEGSRASRLGEVARYFLQLGFTAFGGPAAHVALMERQLVEQRKWLDREHFLDMISAINLIPGPNSTQLAISLGYLRAGPAGLVVAGICFIMPAVLIILPIAWWYVLYGQTPHASDALRGVNAAVLAIVATAALRLGQASVKDSFTAAVAIAAAAVSLAGHLLHWPGGDLAAIAAAAVAGIIKSGAMKKRVASSFCLLPPAIAAVPAGLMSMASQFLKIGATLYGSGYLLLPYLRTNFVTAHSWLTERQLLDAVAVGQVTPGPLLTTATFVGFILGFDPRFAGGIGGAFAGSLLATAAIFAPSFLFIAVLGKILPAIRYHPAARQALDAMNAAVVSLIVVTLVLMAPPVFYGPHALLAGVIVAGTLLVLLRWNVNATWPILAAAVIAAIV